MYDRETYFIIKTIDVDFLSEIIIVKPHNNGFRNIYFTIS